MLRESSTPGDVLREEYLVPSGLSAKKFAEALDIEPGTLSRVINGKGIITANLALRLGKVLGTTPLFWLNLQMYHDISVAKADPALTAKLARLTPYFPSTPEQDD